MAGVVIASKEQSVLTIDTVLPRASSRTAETGARPFTGSKANLSQNDAQKILFLLYAPPKPNKWLKEAVKHFICSAPPEGRASRAARATTEYDPAALRKKSG